MLLRGFKTQCFCAILELEKIFEDLKNLFSKGLYLSTTGQENELCQISLQKDEKLERFFSETDPNLVNVSIYHMPLRFSEKKKKNSFFTSYIMLWKISYCTWPVGSMGAISSSWKVSCNLAEMKTILVIKRNQAKAFWVFFCLQHRLAK